MWLYSLRSLKTPYRDAIDSLPMGLHPCNLRLSSLTRLRVHSAHETEPIDRAHSPATNRAVLQS